jgi:hypothetical protein
MSGQAFSDIHIAMPRGRRKNTVTSTRAGAT